MTTTPIKRRDFDLDNFTAEENTSPVANESPIAISFYRDVIFSRTVVAKSIRLLEVHIGNRIQFYLLKKELKNKYNFENCRIKTADLYLCCREDGSINLFPVLHPDETGSPTRYNNLTHFVTSATKQAIILSYDKTTKEITRKKATTQIKPDWPHYTTSEDLLYKLCNGYIIKDASHAIMVERATTSRCQEEILEE